MTYDKILQAFGEFAPLPSPSVIEQEVATICEEAIPQLDQEQTLLELLSCVDLTSLKSEDNEQNITKMVHRVNDLEDAIANGKNVASVCVYPNQIGTVKEALTDPNVSIASVVGGFPSGQTLEEVKVAEAALAVMEGANELDMTISYGAFLAEDYEKVASEIMEVKAAAPSAMLKVILETGLLRDPEKVQKASILALYSGADFIKTSTGKEYPGADIVSVYVMCQTLKSYYEKHNQRRGIKISGGLTSIQDALKYYAIVQSVLGKEWITPDYFRIGTSRLFDTLVEALEIGQ